MELSLLLLLCLFLGFLRGLVTIFHVSQRILIPQDSSEPLKLFFSALLLNATFRLGTIMEKLGICKQIIFMRKLMILCTFREDPRVHIREVKFGDVPVRIYEPKWMSPGTRRCVFYFHGGICMFGTTKGYARVCSCLAQESESMVVDIEYRLAPEHPYPAPYKDCYAVLQHILTEAENYGIDLDRILFAGDSSGGMMAASTCQFLVTRRKGPKVRAQVLIYPFLQTLDFTLPSYQQNHSAPILPSKRAVQFIVKYFSEKVGDFSGIMKNAHVPEELQVRYRKWISADHIPNEFKVRGYVPPPQPAPFSEKLYEECQSFFQEDVSPLLADDDVIGQLPETFILTCEYDVLRDDGLLYKKRLEDNGVPVTWFHLKNGFHGVVFLSDHFLGKFRDAKLALEQIVSFIKRF